VDSLPIEKLLAKTGSVYKLVILASRRAAELNAGAPALIETPKEKRVSTVALEEILQDKVGIKGAGEKSNKSGED
jgi:DNA-directed RNA polymerase omega subunit